MNLRPGQRLRSTVSDAEIVVIKAPDGDVDVACGGVAMVDGGDQVTPGAAASGDDGELLLGKRYSDDHSGLEALCSKPGAGTLTVDGRPVDLKSAKPLPSSD